MDKPTMRRHYLEQRRQLSEEEWRRLSEQICRHLMQAAWFQSADTFLMYVPIRREVDIRPVMARVWRDGRKLYLPKVDPATKAMDAYRVEHFDELVPGAYGILEPPRDEGRHGDPRDVDVAFIPGVVFDRNGYRIGYGAGYYDRFLPQLPERTVNVGVAFSLQVVPRLPRDPHDRRLDVLVTEHGVLTFNEG